MDFTAVLPRFLGLYVLSFLNPRDLAAAAQVSWHWRSLAEQVRGQRSGVKGQRSAAGCRLLGERKVLSVFGFVLRLIWVMRENLS